jgi:hypothetical protein
MAVFAVRRYNHSMSAASSSLKDVFFSVPWETANRDVILTKETYYGHIAREHPVITVGKIPLIQRAVEAAVGNREFYKYADGKNDEFFTQYKCPDFEPINDHLRVAFKARDESVFIVATAFPVWGFPKRGIKKYEPGK